MGHVVTFITTGKNVETKCMSKRDAWRDANDLGETTKENSNEIYKQPLYLKPLYCGNNPRALRKAWVWLGTRSSSD